jgi:hypothetical protein
MHVLEPVEVVPAHEFEILLEERGEAGIVGQQVHIIAIADVLADLLLALRLETLLVADELVDVLDLGALSPNRRRRSSP